MRSWESLRGDFLGRELPRGPIDVGRTPTLAAVGTLAEIAVQNPLLREPLAVAGLTPSDHLPFRKLEDLLGSDDWQVGLVISPFKQAVVAHCSRLAPGAEATGVVDTLVRANGELLGLNTNTYAAGEALRQLLAGAGAQRLLLIGTGASARSVAFAVSTWHSTVRLGVYGRSVEHAARLAYSFGAALVESPAEFHAHAIVHATRVGEVDDSVTLGPPVEDAVVAGVRVFDLTNRLTALQVRALASGCVVLSGMLMQRITNRLRVASISRNA